MSADDSMPASDDRYREWDAAYILGSLSPAERHAYENHFALCPECRRALADLAGMPGLLAMVQPAEALAFLEQGDTGAQAPDARTAGGQRGEQGETASQTPDARLAPGEQSVLLQNPTPAHTVRGTRNPRTRRRARLVATAATLLAVAAAVAVTLVVGFSATPALAPAPLTGTPGALASTLTFHSEVSSPLTAEATLDDEPWGTRIDWRCTYEGLAGSAYARDYAMVVTERDGASTQVATWTSGPGTTATPTATTSIHRADIASVSIISTDSGTVLLRSVLQ